MTWSVLSSFHINQEHKNCYLESKTCVGHTKKLDNKKSTQMNLLRGVKGCSILDISARLIVSHIK